jgi:hypothetical protein
MQSATKTTITKRCTAHGGQAPLPQPSATAPTTISRAFSVLRPSCACRTAACLVRQCPVYPPARVPSPPRSHRLRHRRNEWDRRPPKISTAPSPLDQIMLVAQRNERISVGKTPQWHRDRPTSGAASSRKDARGGVLRRTSPTSKSQVTLYTATQTFSVTFSPSISMRRSRAAMRTISSSSC